MTTHYTHQQQQQQNNNSFCFSEVGLAEQTASWDCQTAGTRVSSSAISTWPCVFVRVAYSDTATQTYGVIIQPTQIWHLMEFIIFCFAPGACEALPLSLHRACHRCWCIFLLHSQVLLRKLIQLHDRISTWIIHALHAFCTPGPEKIHMISSIVLLILSYWAVSPAFNNFFIAFLIIMSCIMYFIVDSFVQVICNISHQCIVKLLRQWDEIDPFQQE